ncbi:MAG: hypothetical protein MUF75_12230 [Bacteroidia bacterium]|jgi:hypothetical protein|nr:hypothetical protein [Bacteroidia bacterium]
MKNIILIASFFVLALMSCNKDRVCTCTVVTTGTTNTRTVSDLLGTDTTVTIPLNTTNQNSTTFNDVSKRKAKYNCFDKSESINETTSNGVPGLVTITITNTGTRNYSCELE